MIDNYSLYCLKNETSKLYETKYNLFSELSKLKEVDDFFAVYDFITEKFGKFTGVKEHKLENNIKLLLYVSEDESLLSINVNKDENTVLHRCWSMHNGEEQTSLVSKIAKAFRLTTFSN